MNSKVLPRYLLGATFLFFIGMLATPFISSNQFVDSTLTPKLIWFSIHTTVFISLLFFYFASNPQHCKLETNTIDMAVVVFFLYLHANHFFTDIPYISSKISISTGIAMSYIAIRILLLWQPINTYIPVLVPVVFIAAASMSSITLYQYVSIHYFGKGFGMIATMGNSGAVGSYLAMLFPWMLLFVNASKRNSVQYLYRITIVLTLIALFFMQARAAWVAVLISSAFVFLLQNKKTIQTNIAKYKKASYGLFASLIVFLLLSGYALFQLKKDSASGRLFIWKRTLELIADHPFTGVGFQNFGSIYPKYQATYLQNNLEDPSRFLASDINHAFNEYLHITAELGIIGLILFLAILYLVFLTFGHHQKKQLSNTLIAAYGGVVAFVVLSFFTYPFKIFSVQFLVCCCIAIIASQYKKKLFFLISKRYVIALMAGVCMVMFFTVHSEFKRYEREKSWQQVYKLRNELRWETRAKIFEELYPLNATNWDFLSIYGIELTVHKDYQKAIPILEKAAKYQKTSDIYTHLGISLEETGAYKKAKAAYETAIYMVPHKFFPRYRLVYLYDKMDLEKEALTLAKTMSITPAKVHSRAVQGMKYEMRKYIQKHAQK